MSIRYGLLLLVSCGCVAALAREEDSWDRECDQWGRYCEWELTNPSYAGNPYDLVATVTFAHEASGERRTTGMFYAGGDTWKFRFTGSRPGSWRFETNSCAEPLNGRRGTVMVRPNEHGYGFVTSWKNRWARPKGAVGELELFVPQLVMYGEPPDFYQRPGQVDADIQTFIVEHGFNGFHVPVFCRWFDLQKDQASDIDDPDPNPDPRTFEALELLITKAHAAGAFVHLWVWGDEQRTMTPRKWGINGEVDRRLQRYMAARLGPLPGWTMGYGFDLWEWVKEEQLVAWQQHMHAQLGWPHLLGARAHQHGRPLRDLMTARLDYVGFETHRPDYDVYAQALERHPDKPVFMEDRFRIREGGYPEKDYDEEMTRRGLWHSSMAGGVANIWGHLLGESSMPRASRPYPRPDWIKTNAEFLRGRFLKELQRDQTVSDGPCLCDPECTRVLVYQEGTRKIRLDLSRMSAPQAAVAVDTTRPYEEIRLGRLPARAQVWEAPRQSDWAIAIGDFTR